MARLLGEVLHTPWRSDQELVRAVRGGDDRAFEELFTRYRGRIGAYVTGILGDSDRAEEVTQEVFISALRRLRESERPIAFKPWAYQIARNASIDELRRARRSHEVPLDDAQDDPDGGLHHCSPHPSAETAVESKQQLEDLRAAFRGLSELHHRILVLRELEGLSYSEIGERLDMSRPVVESTLFRARRRLAEEYQELISGRRCESTRAAIDAWAGRALRRMGIRERRRLSRHLAHCQVCRRHAFLTGVGGAIHSASPGASAPAPRPAHAGGAGAGAKARARTPIPLAQWRRPVAEPEAGSAPNPASRAVA